MTAAATPSAAPWHLVYHEKCQKDAKKLDRQTVETLRTVIEQKLRSDPQKYGGPYHSDLKGLWKLKFGKLRVVFMIDEPSHTVHVAAMGWRHTIGEVASIDMLQRRWAQIRTTILDATQQMAGRSVAPARAGARR